MSESNVNTGLPGDPTVEKDPEDWVTGGEPATGAQRSYLETLSRRAGEEPAEHVSEDLTKADASRKIDDLKQASAG
jgi:hypothetical protein